MPSDMKHDKLRPPGALCSGQASALCSGQASQNWRPISSQMKRDQPLTRHKLSIGRRQSRQVPSVIRHGI